MNLDDCFLLGTITKSHGYKGHLSLKIDGALKQKIPKMERLYLEKMILLFHILLQNIAKMA